ncbi:MAG: toll/interleukin-1 receptor domain-containing protein [Chitinophagaceae bacterium]
MPNWLFITLLIANALVLIDRFFLGYFGMYGYNTIFFLVIQVILIIVYRFKTKPSSQVDRHSKSSNIPPPSFNQHVKKNIFINYRKEDSSGYSLALYHELLKWYHKDTIFKDFNTIEPGEDFEEAIDNALNGASILIVLIGDKWNDILNIRVKKNQKDFVRIEIATALSKKIYTIPVTINGTSMPSEEELPEDLAKLTHRQFLDIDQTRFDTDILKLVRIIDKRLGIERAKK